MIDVHAHILPLVDDGSTSVESSLEMLFEAEKQGITDIILTPHYKNNYEKTYAELLYAFDEFCAKKEQLKISVNLYLGQEAFIYKTFKEDIKEGKIFSLCGSKYILVEFDYFKDTDIAEAVYDLTKLGLIPIVAHFERYTYANIVTAREIKSLGGLIQINADALIGKSKWKYAKKIKPLFKENLVDFIASDVHYARKNYMKKAYALVLRKYGQGVAQALFYDNAKKIIEG